ncbi:MAG: YidC/Oxa1 family membrane protein insertase [Patescibacteria group bacterium]
MSNFFNTILFEPLFNALIFLYQTIALKDLGLAIILLTILIRFILYPVFQKSIKDQRALQEIQPKLKKVQEEHKKDRVKQSEAMMALYKEHKLNPFSPFLTLIIQLPVLITLYKVFRTILIPDFSKYLYSITPIPQAINYSFLGLINLTQSNIFIVVLAVLAQYFQGKLSLPKKTNTGTLSTTEKMSQKMVLFAPVLTGVVLLSLPSALGLFWTMSSVFSIWQDWISRKHQHGQLDNIRKTTD